MPTATAQRPRPKFDREPTAPMLKYLDVLYAEREDFGYVPGKPICFQEASELIDRGKRTPRKQQVEVNVVPGYYVMPDEIVYVVVRSKSNPDRTYAKVLVVSERGRARWDYAPGEVRKLAEQGLKPLSVWQAARLGKKYGVCVACGRTLTDDTTKGRDGLTSIQRGMGPKCFENRGFIRDE